MRQQRAVLVGAGIGGLAAALDLAAAGWAVTVLERQAAPGGKMRRVQAGDATLDAGPTVFTMRWVFEELFADARHHPGRRGDAASRRHTRPARLVTDRNAGPARRPGPVGRRHRRFRRPTRGGRLPRLLRSRQADLRYAGDALPARQASHAAIPRAPGGRALHAGDQPVRHDDACARPALHRPPPAPVVRPLRHLLRLLALSGTGDTHAGGACGT